MYSGLSTTIQRMVGAAMVRKIADYLVQNDGPTHAIQLLDTHWHTFGFGALGEF